ncbi:VOC family protein [Rhodoferax sp. WC2427]|uniref:VOC family protein n=1 Tax=Rhodoferax sp. WC2427 TaxID=3234144 RepID=UPI0034650921
MPILNALASVAVKDMARAVPWYASLFGRPPDARPMPEVAEWKFEHGGWLQVYLGPERAGSGSVTLAVSSIDEQLAALANCGVAAGSRATGPLVKTLMISDPDGNHIAFAEAIDPKMAR